MRLAMLTTVPSMLAAETADSPDSVAMFRKAYRELTGVEAPAI
jgi:hypothetical protein